MMLGIRRAALVSMTCAMLFGTGCEQPDWTNPEYVKSQLNEADGTKIRVAIGKIKEMSGEDRKPYGKELANLYMGEELNEIERKDVMDFLLTMRSEDAKEAYINELETNSSKLGGKAATVLSDMGAKDALPSMLKLLETSADPDTQVSVLQAFETMPDISMLPALTTILQKDTDNTQIRLLSYSCDIVGDIALEKPAALSDETIDALIVSLFKTNATGQNLATTCGVAVQKLGAPAIPKLVAVYKQENKAVQSLLLKYNTAKAGFGFPPLLATKRAGVMLAALRAKELAPLIAERMDKPTETPKMLKGDAYEGWNKVLVQMAEEQVLALGDVGAVEQKDFLLRIVHGEMDEPWKHIMKDDPAAQAVIRQNAAVSLSKLGDRSVASELLKAATEDRITKVEEIAVHAEKKGKPLAPTQRYAFNYMAARAFAAVAAPEDKPGYSKKLAGLEDNGLRGELAKVAGMLALAVSCGDKADAKAKAGCYEEKLSSGDEMVREKAVFELGMMPSEFAAPALVKGLETDSLATRELVVFFLYRHPSKDAIPVIEKLLDAQKDKGGAAVTGDNIRLKSLAVYLKHNAK